MVVPLVIERALDHPPSRGVSDPGVTVWRDAVGMPWGYGFVDVDGHWLCVPRVANFQLDRKAGVVRAHPRLSVPLHRVRETYEQGVLPLVLHAIGVEVLHASAADLGGGVVALCGVSGTGKSTMAEALGRRGCRPRADDAVALDLSRPQPRVMSLPFRIRPRSPSGCRSDSRIAPEPLARDERAHSSPDRDPRPLTALFVLTRAATAGDAIVTPLTPAAAFSLVLSHAYCFSLDDPSRTRCMLEAYSRLVTSVPVFHVVFGAGLQRLPTILDTMERVVASAGTAPG